MARADTYDKVRVQVLDDDIMRANFLCERTREGRYERFGTRVGRKHRGSDLSSERPHVQNQPAFSTINFPVSHWICKVGETDRWIMPGSTACVTRTVPATFIVTISSFSCSIVSAKYVGIVCDLPTLFTVVNVTLQSEERGQGKREIIHREHQRPSHRRPL